MAITHFLQKVAPKYAAQEYKGQVDVLEHDAGAAVRKVTWTSADFSHFDHSLAKDMTSFFQIAKSPDIFHLDCDGVVMFENNGKKYMFLTELKSKFATQTLYHAKTQIISSFLKTNMFLHLSNCYKLEDYTIKGFIVGYAPAPDFTINMHKGSMLPGKSQKYREFQLAHRLFIRNRLQKIILKPTDFLCLKGMPIGERGIFPEIELHYITMPDGSSEITLDANAYL